MQNQNITGMLNIHHNKFIRQEVLELNFYNDHQTAYGIDFNAVQESLNNIRYGENQISLIIHKFNSFSYIAYVETEFDNSMYIKLLIIQDHRIYKIVKSILDVCGQQGIMLNSKGWKRVIKYHKLHIFKQYKLPYKPFYLNKTIHM